MGQQLGLMAPPPAPNPPRHHDTHKSIISRDTWPKASGSKRTSTRTSFHGQSVSIRPIIVPKFVSDPSPPVQPGYQEAHKIYDEMRQFFAQKAMAVHNGEVVVIKVTMMSLKPGNRNPSVVSVRETNVLSPRHFSDYLSTEHFRDHFQHTCLHQCLRTQGHHVLHSASSLHEMVEGLYSGY